MSGAENTAPREIAGTNVPNATLPPVAQAQSLGMLTQVVMQLEHCVQSKDLSAILTTKAKPSKIWSAKAGALVNRPMSPAGQGQGQKTKGQRVSPTPRPNSWTGSSLHR